jgi:uncharacterized protein YndB with AHSA1/START domain
MPDILQDLFIDAAPASVFDAVSTAAGLTRWWADTCDGSPAVGSAYAFGFGPEYQWRAQVTQCAPATAFALTFTQADTDWTGTRVTFDLVPEGSGTQLRFAHGGWPEANAHFRVSAHCWALYLRLLRRYVERGETVPYAMRLDA